MHKYYLESRAAYGMDVEYLTMKCMHFDIFSDPVVYNSTVFTVHQFDCNNDIM